jgi:hypothetical protein
MRNLVKDVASVMNKTVHEDLSTRDGRVYQEVLDEAKWETPPNTPFKDIKKNDHAYVYHPSQLDKKGVPTHPGQFAAGRFTGTVRKGEKDRNGHLQFKLNGSGPYEFHWIHPDHVFKSTGDAAKGPRPVKEAVSWEMQRTIAKLQGKPDPGPKPGSSGAVSDKMRATINKLHNDSKRKPAGSDDDQDKLTKDRNDGYNVASGYPTTKVSEAIDGTDHVTMTVPLLIRCLEWAKEEAKDDVEIHKFVENIVAKGGVLETDDYEDFLKEGKLCNLAAAAVIGLSAAGCSKPTTTPTEPTAATQTSEKKDVNQYTKFGRNFRAGEKIKDRIGGK